MILVSGIVVPKCVAMRADSPYAGLNDVIATGEAGEFGDINGGTLQRPSANASGIGNCVIFRVADDANLLDRVSQNRFVIMNTTRH